MNRGMRYQLRYFNRYSAQRSCDASAIYVVRSNRIMDWAPCQNRNPCKSCRYNMNPSLQYYTRSICIFGSYKLSFVCLRVQNSNKWVLIEYELVPLLYIYIYMVPLLYIYTYDPKMAGKKKGTYANVIPMCTFHTKVPGFLFHRHELQFRVLKSDLALLRGLATDCRCLGSQTNPQVSNSRAFNAGATWILTRDSQINIDLRRCDPSTTRNGNVLYNIGLVNLAAI